MHKASSETNSESIIPKVDMDAKSMLDTNVTRRSHSSSKMEQESVEPGNEEFGSSLQRIGSNLSRNEGETIETNFDEAKHDTVPGDFEDLMEMVVLKEDFKDSVEIISQRLEQIPHNLSPNVLPAQ